LYWYFEIVSLLVFFPSWRQLLSSWLLQYPLLHCHYHQTLLLYWQKVASMKKEVDAMKEKKPAERRFQNTNTKSRNTIFIKTTLEDPSTLAHTILTDIYEQIQNDIC
jgi:hypothetical protein